MHGRELLHQVGLPAAVQQLPQRPYRPVKLLPGSVHGHTQRPLPPLQQRNHILQKAVVAVGCVRYRLVALHRSGPPRGNKIAQDPEVTPGFDPVPAVDGFAVKEGSQLLPQVGIVQVLHQVLVVLVDVNHRSRRAKIPE
uniref:(northern house mosquito) hypothetical protein n=1 Tax=Culex pipiens TaxID=7175 RepID=A0A8D8BVG5_CULPI